jgi:hypothetical protein
MPDQADDAVTELHQRSHRLSIGAEPASPGAASAAASEPEEAPPVLTMRTSSFAVIKDLAKSRINTFKQAQEAREQEAAAPKPTKFGNKLDKFKRLENPVAKASVNTEECQKLALKAKLVAFEQKSKTEPMAFKKSWRNQTHGSWKQKTTFAGGPAAKQSMADLLKKDK